MSFHDKQFAFTCRTCLAAAKTIINEVKEEFSDNSPILWTMQAFSVAAGVNSPLFLCQLLIIDNASDHFIT
jgi:hypothetical protein